MKPKPKTCEPDRIVYHYCDANALLSILEHKKLRFTHAAFVNDTSEIHHGLKICKQVLQERLGIKPLDQIVRHTIEYLNRNELWQYYLCCFSESRDKLSQWRAYAGNGSGFAIGFHTSNFQSSADGLFMCEFKKVDYARGAILNTINTLLDSYERDLVDFPPEDSYAESIYESSGVHIGNILLDEAVFVKDPGFAEEEEWRATRSYKHENTQLEQKLTQQKNPGEIVTIFKELQRDFIGRRLVRVGYYGLTPYIEMEFDSKSLKEIVCGPRTPHGLTETSLAILKKKYNLSFEISRSAATYR